jgi:hypothetical protein
MSQRNPIDELIVTETVPSILATKSNQQDDLDEKVSLDPEDGEYQITGRCLDGEEYKSVTWTIDEQRRAVRKVDFFLLPIFMVSDSFGGITKRY